MRAGGRRAGDAAVDCALLSAGGREPQSCEERLSTPRRGVTARVELTAAKNTSMRPRARAVVRVITDNAAMLCWSILACSGWPLRRAAAHVLLLLAALASCMGATLVAAQSPASE